MIYLLIVIMIIFIILSKCITGYYLYEEEKSIKEETDFFYLNKSNLSNLEPLNLNELEQFNLKLENMKKIYMHKLKAVINDDEIIPNDVDVLLLNNNNEIVCVSKIIADKYIAFKIIGYEYNSIPIIYKTYNNLLKNLIVLKTKILNERKLLLVKKHRKFFYKNITLKAFSFLTLFFYGYIVYEFIINHKFNLILFILSIIIFILTHTLILKKLSDYFKFNPKNLTLNIELVNNRILNLENSINELKEDLKL